MNSLPSRSGGSGVVVHRVDTRDHRRAPESALSAEGSARHRRDRRRDRRAAPVRHRRRRRDHELVVRHVRQARQEPARRRGVLGTPRFQSEGPVDRRAAARLRPDRRACGRRSRRAAADREGPRIAGGARAVLRRPAVLPRDQEGRGQDAVRAVERAPGGERRGSRAASRPAAVRGRR